MEDMRIYTVTFCRLQDLSGYGVSDAEKIMERGITFMRREVRQNLIPMLPIIEESRRLANIMPGGKQISVTDREIVEMILFPVVNEACRIMDEGVVVQASDLDVASVLGMSFPSYRGGIVFWGDTVGAVHICRSLEKWSELYGNFFKPSRFLEERAAKGIPLVMTVLTNFMEADSGFQEYGCIVMKRRIQDINLT
ncbi:Altered inheritance of mitochondria protein 1 [Datura stramonium]|uniref:Altered inheritance of mitochondria protein 1 n=1 Tax=Datura stramonium TaxID=4076 RepID=A0ABS8T8B5_DATST|nr:Altered inheritance of mitochondria protein 1 [Datura stramonium]